MEGANVNDKKHNDIIDERRPFLGLSSYGQKNKSQFGGRDDEIKELFSLVDSNKLTIVFGKSGLGKTSLINAGLIPELQNNYYFPIYIRIDYSANKTPLVQLRELIYEKLKMSDTTIPEIGERTFWEYFQNIKFLNGLLTPVLIFDQFEETFTIGKEKSIEIHEFIIELSDLAENRVPLVVQKEQQGLSEKIPSHFSEQKYHIILSLREDYLANLESLKKYLPSMKDSRFRVVEMSVLKAMEAVIKPAKDLVTRDIAAEIIKKLPGISEFDFNIPDVDQGKANRLIVEPFLLSMLCYEINEKRIEKGLENISPELVSLFDISDVIDSYYNKTMKSFGEHVQKGIEDAMLTENGFRKLQELEEFESKYKVNSTEIQQLIERRIIRKELRDGVEYVELIHDVLAPLIREKRDKRNRELLEKEKSDAIRRAIELDRAKRKRIIRTALLIVVPIIAVLVIFAMIENANKAKATKRYENLDFAQKLLFIAKGVSTNFHDSNSNSKAALISRAAYIINKKDNGGNDVIFYHSMYNRLNDLNNFYRFNGYNSQINAIATSHDDIYYSGNDDGIVFRKDSMQPEHFYDLKKKVTSIATSHEKKYTAVAGIFDNVVVFDNLNSIKEPKRLLTGDRNGAGKTVCFTEDGRLILLLTSKIIGWDVNSWKQFSWKERIQVELENGNELTINPRVMWNRDSLSFNGVNKINCMAVFKDKIALGIDSGLILIKKDSLIKIKSPELNRTTAVEFHAKGKYLFIGNDQGNICRMSLFDYKIECNLYQERIFNITSSSDGNYLASASWDGSISIWDLRNTWSSMPLLLSRGEGTHSLCVSFSNDGQNVLAGYSDGNIWTWPVSLDLLASNICKNVNVSLDTLTWKEYFGKRINIKEMEEYNCTTIKGKPQ